VEGPRPARVPGPGDPHPAPPQPANPFTTPTPSQAAPLKATSVKPLGNYAYSIDFSDGHGSGIYSLEYLRELGDRKVSENKGPQTGTG